MEFLVYLVRGVMYLVIADAVLSWIQPDPEAVPRRYLAQLTDPLYKPVRAILPSSGPFDFSPLVIIILLQLLSSALAGTL